MVVRTVLADDTVETVASPPETDEAPADAAVMTGADLLVLGDVGRAELVEGELICMTPIRTGNRSTFIAHGPKLRS